MSGNVLKIGVLNAKGGVGKTLLSVNLAVRAARDYARVGIVDLDPQRGSARWRGHRGGNPDTDNPMMMAGAIDAADAAEKLELDGWDVAFFDGAPNSLELTEDAIKVVDFVVIPLRASDQDIASTEFVVSACKEFGRKFLLVINEAMPGRKPENAVTGDKRALEVYRLFDTYLKVPIARTVIHRRVAYTDGINTGKAGFEAARSDDTAVGHEIDKLYSEIMTAARAAHAARSAADA